MTKAVVPAVKPGGWLIARHRAFSLMHSFLPKSGAIQPLDCGSAGLVDILKSKAWLRRTVWSVLAVLVLWALGWLALPPLLRSQGQKLASEALGRDVRIGRIEFVPWSLQLTVHDVAVATADGQRAQFTVTRVLADVGMASLLRLAPVLDALEVDELVQRLAQLFGVQ